MVQFNLSWENSWRTSAAPNNRDAAQVFVKYRVGSGDWQHTLLSNTLLSAKFLFVHYKKALNLLIT
jgi:hypothetical protein